MDTDNDSKNLKLDVHDAPTQMDSGDSSGDQVTAPNMLLSLSLSNFILFALENERN